MTRSFAQMPPATQPLLRLHSVLARPLRGSRVTMFTVPLSCLFWLAICGDIARAASPADEIVAAQSAVARAEQADAEQYDPQSLLRARGHLLRAQNAKRGEEAADAAMLSEAEADLARARSLEASAAARLTQRRNELRDLRRQLESEGQR